MKMNIKLYKNPFFDITIMLVDIILVILSSFFAYKIISIFKEVNIMSNLSITLFVCCIYLMFHTYDFYTKMIRSKYEILLSVCISVIVSTIAVIIFEFLFSNYITISSSLYFIFMPVVMFLMLGVWKLISLHIIKRIEGVAKLLVIESKDVETSLARKVKYSYMELYEAWYLQIDVNSQVEIDNLVNEKFKDYESIFISPAIPNDLRNFLISKAVSQYKEIYILPDLYNISVMKNETVQFEDTPALRIKPFGLTKIQRIFKRILDIVVSFIGILITSPIMLIVAICIKLDSKGPVIYKQVRATFKQKRFNVYKFRTMRDDAEKCTGAVLACEDDDRITRVGKVLRRLRIDELPQLFNILFGSMSIVGPRPERPVFIDLFMNEIENYDKRFFTKAGLTGLAQVYARYDTSAKDKTLYDLLYIKDYSFWMDIKLILLTVKIMFVKGSSEGVGSRPNYQSGYIKREDNVRI
jgi:exopolysaccharide biosynthesis polyprenyl glycosylphosphotransferase